MTQQNHADRLIALTAEITAAWLSHDKNRIAPGDLPVAVTTIHRALASLSASTADAAAAEPEVVPAVSVRRSLASRDHLISLIDGKPYKSLKRHLASHGYTPEQYRERFGLKADYPMVALGYSDVRRRLAVDNGLWRKSLSSDALVETIADAVQNAEPEREGEQSHPATFPN